MIIQDTKGRTLTATLMLSPVVAEAVFEAIVKIYQKKLQYTCSSKTLKYADTSYSFRQAFLRKGTKVDHGPPSPISLAISKQTHFPYIWTKVRVCWSSVGLK